MIHLRKGPDSVMGNASQISNLREQIQDQINNNSDRQKQCFQLYKSICKTLSNEIKKN